MTEAVTVEAQSASAGVASAPVLEARGLSKRYDDVEAVVDLDLRVGPSEIYCLLGPNGAGKTTTIHLFLGFLEPTAGSVRVMGLDVAAEPLESKRRLAYVPEQVMLYRNLSGLENLEYFAALGGTGSLAPERLTDILVGAGLPATRSVSACPSTRRACGRRSASPSPSPRRPARCCSTSPRRGSTPRPRTSSRSCSSGSGTAASRC